MVQVFRCMPLITDSEVQHALDIACAQVERNIKDFTFHCQNHSSVKGFYPQCENEQWTCGFWPGELWLSFEYTGSGVFKDAANIIVESFLHRIENKIAVDHHDMGFLYTPSCVSSYMLTGNLKAKRAALLASEQLCTRYQPRGKFLQAWGDMGASENYRYIIDCLLNVPLLYWAARECGDSKKSLCFREIADNHILTCMTHSFRSDYSTYHTFFMDPKTGEGDHGATCQGYRDDSSWARGQAWAVYGTALAYKYLQDPAFIKVFEGAADYFLSRLPSDLIPYWDLIFTSGNEPRDSSSASIVACGLLEMAKAVDKERKRVYISVARQLVKALYDTCAVKDFSKSNGLVMHGTYSKKSPYNTCTEEGVDECVSWGDYFYMEALTRLHTDWKPYW